MEISQLEKTIRNNAVDKRKIDLWETIYKHPSMAGLNNHHKLQQAVRGFIEEQREQIGDRAVRDFMTTYEKLIVQYPEVVEDRDELQSELMT